MPVEAREQMQTTTPSVPQTGSTERSRNREAVSLSVCIATHERPLLLAKTLAALARQTRPAGEIIISDSSASVTSSALVADFARQHPGLGVRRVASRRSALPWQRWWAFSHSQGEVVLFLDDDVELQPEALQLLLQNYETPGLLGTNERVAGVGFVMSFADNSRKERRPFSFEERWLKTSNLPSASVLPGGTTIPPKLALSDGLVRVQRLSGGAMSFRREILAKIGPLERLYELYENRLGRGEDAVLSWYAGRQGALYIVTQALAIHPLDEQAKCSACAVAGWRLGMTETWGRAHTMRWMAVSRSALWSEWSRVATLEILRAIWWGLLKNPFRGNNWSRFAGAVYGTIRTLADWKSIPETASVPPNNSCTLVPK